MLQVQRAAAILKERYGVTSDIWGVTSYQLVQGVNPDKLYSAEV
jgi:pyruvate dehydrogenase complex dehydrogenase (E1) component